MISGNVEQIPVSSILVVNPRTRNRVKWLAIVASIRSVGLKKPIEIARREKPDGDGKTYDLICGQGRLEAHIELGQSHIGAIITEASKEDRHLMSLVENIARRPSSNRAIYFEVRALLERGDTARDIAKKLGFDRTYINNIVRLVQRGESKLIEYVEAGRLPISVAIEIANEDDEAIQKALIEVYESGEMRGSKLQTVRILVKDRRAKRDGAHLPQDKPLSGAALANLYKQRVRDQQRLVLAAGQAQEKLLMVTSLIRTLVLDEDLLTLLRAEGLYDMPEQLAKRVWWETQ